MEEAATCLFAGCSVSAALCIDEKTADTSTRPRQAVFSIRPGQLERRSHADTRHGTTSLFAALDNATGKIIGGALLAPSGAGGPSIPK